MKRKLLVMALCVAMFAPVVQASFCDKLERFPFLGSERVKECKAYVFKQALDAAMPVIVITGLASAGIGFGAGALVFRRRETANE